jgi:hypothetical protein
MIVLIEAAYSCYKYAWLIATEERSANHTLASLSSIPDIVAIDCGIMCTHLVLDVSASELFTSCSISVL